MELLCLAEGGTDADGHVAGDLRVERTGFTTGFDMVCSAWKLDEE